MIVDTAEFRCTLMVLELISKGTNTYNDLFRATKVSHTTLQKVLTELTKKNCLDKKDDRRMQITYEITEKGSELIKALEKVRILLYK